HAGILSGPDIGRDVPQQVRHTEVDTFFWRNSHARLVLHVVPPDHGGQAGCLLPDVGVVKEQLRAIKANRNLWRCHQTTTIKLDIAGDVALAHGAAHVDSEVSPRGPDFEPGGRYLALERHRPLFVLERTS